MRIRSSISLLAVIAVLAFCEDKNADALELGLVPFGSLLQSEVKNPIETANFRVKREDDDDEETDADDEGEAEANDDEEEEEEADDDGNVVDTAMTALEPAVPGVPVDTPIEKSEIAANSAAIVRGKTTKYTTKKPKKTTTKKPKKTTTKKPKKTTTKKPKKTTTKKPKKTTTKKPKKTTKRPKKTTKKPKKTTRRPKKYYHHKYRDDDDHYRRHKYRHPGHHVITPHVEYVKEVVKPIPSQVHEYSVPVKPVY